MIKAIFANFIVGSFLILCPARAMMGGSQEEERPQLSCVNLSPQGPPQNELSSSTSSKHVPEEILSIIFVLLEVNDLGRLAQVSSGWKKFTENPDLWTYIGAKHYGDYLNEEDLRETPKQKVVGHYLSVLVNKTESFLEIHRHVRQYRLDLYLLPLKKYIKPKFLINLASGFSCYEDLVEFVAQDNENAIERILGETRDLSTVRQFNERLVEYDNRNAIERKTQGFLRGENGYEKNPIAAKEVNELLVKKGDPAAIERKVRGLAEGRYGYAKSPTAAREFNDFLVKKADSEAYKRKILGLLGESYGYEKNSETARELNDLLVERGNAEAIERKIKGLARGKYGYEKDPKEAREFNDLLIEKRDMEAIERKTKGLLEGKFGYEKDLTAARKFNELLIGKDYGQAIERKIGGLLEGKYGYEKDLIAAREFNELLVERDDPEASKRKFIGLAEGKCGYERDLVALRELNDFLVEKGDPEAIRRKIEGLTEENHNYSTDSLNVAMHPEMYPRAKNGYKKDPKTAREFIESLVTSKFPLARGIGKYLKAFAMKYGVLQLGYTKDRKEAFKFIRENHVPY